MCLLKKTQQKMLGCPQHQKLNFKQNATKHATKLGSVCDTNLILRFPQSVNKQLPWMWSKFKYICSKHRTKHNRLECYPHSNWNLQKQKRSWAWRWPKFKHPPSQTKNSINKENKTQNGFGLGCDPNSNFNVENKKHERGLECDPNSN